MSSKPAPTESLVSGHGNATVTSMSECPQHVVNRDVKRPESREGRQREAGRSAAPRHAAGRARAALTWESLAAGWGTRSASAPEKKKGRTPQLCSTGACHPTKAPGDGPRGFSRFGIPACACARIQHASGTHPACIQLASTHPACTQHASSTHSICIQHASSTHSICIQHTSSTPL